MNHATDLPFTRLLSGPMDYTPGIFQLNNFRYTEPGSGIIDQDAIIPSTIAKELARNQYQGKISFSGFGENLLNPEFIEIVKIFSKYIPDATLECNTNGDKLNKDYLSSLFSNSGLDYLYIKRSKYNITIRRFEQQA